jgi:hypothetical protein
VRSPLRAGRAQGRLAVLEHLHAHDLAPAERVDPAGSLLDLGTALLRLADFVVEEDDLVACICNQRGELGERDLAPLPGPCA